MASKVFILFDAYYPEPNRREVHSVYTTRDAAEVEMRQLQANGGRWEIEEHPLLVEIDRRPRRVHAD